MGKITLDAAAANAITAGSNGADLVPMFGPDGQLLGGTIPPNLFRDVQWMLERRRRALDEAFADMDVEAIEAEIAAGGGIPHEEAMKRWGLE